MSSAGSANALYGLNAAGLDDTADQLWHQDVEGVEGVVEAYDRLGNQPTTSNFVYRVPYFTGTDVKVGGDLYSHSPDLRETDMTGVPNGDNEQYSVVAAGTGTIVAIRDSWTASATNEDNNNYVWIAHSNGEWTKYTHLETNSVTQRGHFVGKFVTVGTVLGFEGSVGAERVHLHFEVAVPDDPSTRHRPHLRRFHPGSEPSPPDLRHPRQRPLQRSDL